MKFVFSIIVLSLSAAGLNAATVTLDNFNTAGDAGYGIRDSAGVLVSGSSFKGMMGRFTISDSAVTSNFTAGDTAAIAAGFDGFNPTAAGQFTLDNYGSGLFQGSVDYDTKTTSNTFGGSTIYAVLFKGTSLATATELFIAKMTTTFPTDPLVGLAQTGAASIKPDGISSILVGNTSPLTNDYGFGGGALPTYQMALVGAAPEPSRAMLAGLGLMGLVIRRRRK